MREVIELRRDLKFSSGSIPLANIFFGNLRFRNYSASVRQRSAVCGVLPTKKQQIDG